MTNKDKAILQNIEFELIKIDESINETSLYDDQKKQVIKQLDILESIINEFLKNNEGNH